MPTEARKQFIQGNTYYHYAHPQDEFDRNFKLMKELGMNAVRVAEIWPGWSVIEHKEGQYDYEELDRFVELAGKNGLEVCMGVGINDTPFWAYYKFSGLRMVDTDGIPSDRRVQSACIDHEQYRSHMERFVVNITERYGKNPYVTSFQIGNEVRYNVNICDCPSTRIRFREWLKQKYENNLDRLNTEWGVYYNSFDEIYPYGSRDGAPTSGVTTHYLNSKLFQNFALEELISSNTAIMKKITDKPIFHNSFGTPNMNGSHYNLAAACDIAAIDIYATTYEKTWVYQGLMLDITKTIARMQNKPFIIGETPAGQYGTYNRIPVDKRISEACTIEQIGAGAEAVYHFRHKAPRFEQPHKFTGSQTFLRVDETEMEYAQIPKTIAAFMHRHGHSILSKKPEKAQTAVYYPDLNIMLGKAADYQKEAIQSAYGARAIVAGGQFDVDVVDTQMLLKTDVNAYKVLVIPVSYLLPDAVGQYIKAFVQNGGMVICEGRPGYVDEYGWLYNKQPGSCLWEVFGATEDIFFNTDSTPAKVSLEGFEYEASLPYLKQTFLLKGGTPFITDAEGKACGVYNRYGKGKSYIIGGAPSLFFNMGSGKYDAGKANKDDSQGNKQRIIFTELYKHILTESGVEPNLTLESPCPELSVRRLVSEGEAIYFAVNYSRGTVAHIKLDKESRLLTIDGEEPVSGVLEVPPMQWRVIACTTHHI